MIFQGWPIPGKLTIVNHHGWTSLLRIFRPYFLSFIIATHWAVYQFNFCQEWSLLELFCIQRFKGVTSPGRHTRLACNYVDFHFFLIVTHWIINRRLIRSHGRIFVIQFASWI